ncbi:hypothetical protein D3C84_1201810 [compost metagenome]
MAPIAKVLFQRCVITVISFNGSVGKAAVVAFVFVLKFVDVLVVVLKFVLVAVFPSVILA